MANANFPRCCTKPIELYARFSSIPEQYQTDTLNWPFEFKPACYFRKNPWKFAWPVWTRTFLTERWPNPNTCFCSSHTGVPTRKAVVTVTFVIYWNWVKNAESDTHSLQIRIQSSTLFKGRFHKPILHGNLVGARRWNSEHLLLQLNIQRQASYESRWR